MESYRQLIFNSEDEEVAPILASNGITTEYINTGKALHDEAKALIDSQKIEYQEQELAFDLFHVAYDTAENTLSNIRKKVRVLSRSDKDLQDRIKIGGRMPDAQKEWIEESRHFYNRLLNEPTFLTKLAMFQLTVPVLTAERDSMDNLEALRDEMVKEMGEAQQATLDRNQKIEALSDYCIELRTLAQLALADKPQLLEKLGIIVR